MCIETELSSEHNRNVKIGGKYLLHQIVACVSNNGFNHFIIFEDFPKQNGVSGRPIHTFTDLVLSI